MPETRKYLTRVEYREICTCLQRALAVFARSTRSLTSPELRLKNMLSVLLAELEAALSDGPLDPSAEAPNRPRGP